MFDTICPLKYNVNQMLETDAMIGHDCIVNFFFSAESVFCILVAVGASASVHRVSATTCFLFSMMMLYSLNKISQQVKPHDKIVILQALKLRVYDNINNNINID